MPASAIFGRLRTSLNQGRAWLLTDVLGLQTTRWDVRSLEALEDRLLLGDVGVEATDWLIARLRDPSCRDAALGPMESLRLSVVELLRRVESPLQISCEQKPFVMLVVGVNGTGKTTTVGKLAARCSREGQSVMLAAGDTYRAAAVEQLGEWAQRTGAMLTAQASGADPAAVIFDALNAARSRGVDVLIADTAGRLHTAGGLMDELRKVKRVVGRFDASAPHETLLVLDASQGQNALTQATEFGRALDVSGLVITKLDGTAKGGIVLAIARQLAIPVRFLALGEGPDDLVPFDAEDFAAALLGAEPS